MRVIHRQMGRDAQRIGPVLPRWLTAVAVLAVAGCGADAADLPSEHLASPDIAAPTATTRATSVPDHPDPSDVVEPAPTPAERSPHDLHPAFVALSDLEVAFDVPPLVLRDLLGPYEGGGLPPQCSPVFMGGIEAGGSWRDIDHRMHFFVAAPTQPGWSFLVNLSEFATVEGAAQAFEGSRDALGACEGFTEQGVEWQTEEVRDVAVGDGAFVYAGTAAQSYPPGRVSELGPARVCWIYVRLQDRLTAIGVHGPQQHLDVPSCEAAARSAADRLQ